MEKKLNVLHLEDDYLAAELIGRNLEHEGLSCDITRVWTRADFEAALDRGGFDLVLADYSLPSFDGMSALKAAVAAIPDVPFILVSGVMGEELAVEALKAGATDFVLKSRLSRLGPAVKRALRESADRRERKRLEAQLNHAQKLESLGVLAGGIAHDFNNLLTTMTGYADLALGQLPLGSPARESVEMVLKATEAGASLARQMLAYSGRATFIKAHVGLNAFVEEMAQLLMVSVTKKAELRYELSSEALYVEADKAQLQQVVMNLITNASDAIGDRPGTITVRTHAVEAGPDYFLNTYMPEQPAGRYACIEVADTGAGMDEATKRKIFDPFFTTKFTGRGLGLSAVLGIIRAHGGTVLVDSEFGKGSTFKVYFPAVDAPAEEVAPETRTTEALSAPQKKGRVVLVVEDEVKVRELDRLILEGAGYRVLLAADGHEGVEEFKRKADEIDLVLLDMTMPKMSGVEALAEIRRTRPDVIVVLTSGYAEEDISGSFEDTGRVLFLQKPYRASHLIGKVSEALDGRYTT